MGFLADHGYGGAQVTGMPVGTQHTVEPYRAGVGRQQPGGDFGEGTFARSGCAHNGDPFTRRNGEGDVAEVGGARAVAVGDVREVDASGCPGQRRAGCRRGGHGGQSKQSRQAGTGVLQVIHGSEQGADRVKKTQEIQGPCRCRAERDGAVADQQESRDEHCGQTDELGEVESTIKQIAHVSGAQFVPDHALGCGGEPIEMSTLDPQCAHRIGAANGFDETLTPGGLCCPVRPIDRSRLAEESAQRQKL